MKKVIRKVRTGSSAAKGRSLSQTQLLQQVKPIPLEPTLDMVDLAFAPHLRLESRNAPVYEAPDEGHEPDDKLDPAATVNVPPEETRHDIPMDRKSEVLQGPQNIGKPDSRPPALPPRPSKRVRQRPESPYAMRYTPEVNFSRPYPQRNLYEDVSRFLREGLAAQVLLAEYPSGSLLAIRFFVCIAIIALYPMAGIMLFAVLFGLEVLLDPRSHADHNYHHQHQHHRASRSAARRDSRNFSGQTC